MSPGTRRLVSTAKRRLRPPAAHHKAYHTIGIFLSVKAARRERTAPSVIRAPARLGAGGALRYCR